MFSTFTNLAENGIEFDEFDQIFLSNFEERFKREYLKNNVQFQEGQTCRDLWKSFLEVLWISDEFARFEAKFAAKIVLPFFKKVDGAMLTLSDNLYFRDKLTKFNKHTLIEPDLILMKQMSSFYESSGLTDREKKDLVYGGKQKDHLKHQLKLKDSKLKEYEKKLKEEQQRTKSLQAILDREQDQIRQMIEQRETIQHELDAHKIALRKYLDARPAECIICQTLYTTKTSMKKTSCCGTIICDSCYEDLKMHTQQHNPKCPNCRNFTRQNEKLVPILICDPNTRRLEVCDAETTTDPDVFLESAIGGPEIEPIPKPSRPPSIYAQLLDSQARAGGGGAARPNPPQQRGPPAARADA